MFMSKRMWLGVLVVISGFCAPAARAEDEPSQPSQPYVVLVGIDKYNDGQIKPRQHAEADAQALYDLFTSRDYLGVPKQNIKLLLGAPDKKRDSEEASRANILEA